MRSSAIWEREQQQSRRFEFNEGESHGGNELICPRLGDHKRLHLGLLPPPNYRSRAQTEPVVAAGRRRSFDDRIQSHSIMTLNDAITLQTSLGGR